MTNKSDGIRDRGTRGYRNESWRFGRGLRRVWGRALRGFLPLSGHWHGVGEAMVEVEVLVGEVVKWKGQRLSTMSSKISRGKLWRVGIAAFVCGGGEIEESSK